MIVLPLLLASSRPRADVVGAPEVLLIRLAGRSTEGLGVILEGADGRVMGDVVSFRSKSGELPEEVFSSGPTAVGTISKRVFGVAKVTANAGGRLFLEGRFALAIKDPHSAGHKTRPLVPVSWEDASLANASMATESLRSTWVFCARVHERQVVGSLWTLFK